ncbi:MAG TPA: Sec-independent protein translocase subunit TatA [Kineosporiaceae bacterium]|nr:Sec-independent protein translocase subunit TatA [Kineosporiaceae bacterium]
MLRGLFEGWHIVILVLVIALLFGAKRLPDAARGLGRSLRIFKSEVKQMQDDDRRPGERTADRPVEPLEGRVVDEPRATTPGESSRRDV